MNNEKMQARLDDLKKWWQLSLDPSGESFFSGILDYAIGKLPSIVFAEKAINKLSEKLYKCPAQCPMQFRQWCYKQIDKISASLNKPEKVERKNTKRMIYEQHGDRIFVQLFDSRGSQHIWKFPATWLETAGKLWPVYVRRYPDGRPYIARKVAVIQPDGSREQVEVPVHRLFLGLGALRHDFDDAGEAESIDGSWLNYLDNNIRLTEGSDLFERSYSLSGMEHMVADRPLPAKASVTTSREGSSKPFNRHEASVMKFLSGKYPDEPKIIHAN
jgi:hypothetical protein